MIWRCNSIPGPIAVAIGLWCDLSDKSVWLQKEYNNREQQGCIDVRCIECIETIGLSIAGRIELELVVVHCIE